MSKHTSNEDASIRSTKSHTVTLFNPSGSVVVRWEGESRLEACEMAERWRELAAVGSIIQVTDELGGFADYVVEVER